ncbi:Multi antimicrobial extrusion protein [Dillenia turbinata]|uniref:Protein DETOXIFICATION n=1 Tax=Dillenia turbinata TaxID=194707 RepID=A0AAN8ZI60_9MAGN
MDNGVEERLLGSEEPQGDLKWRVWTESKKSWRVAFPGILYRITAFGLIVVTQAYIGYVGEVQLAAFALVQTIGIRFVNGILLGMSSATETLCGQAFGAGQYHMLGIYLQRSWVVDGVTATILLPIFIFATPILKLLGQDEYIADAAESISIWFVPFIYYFVFNLTMQMYLQAQLKNIVIGVLSTASFVLHLFLSWLFVYKLNWGVAGAMGALNISAWSLVIGELIYVLGGWCPNTWKGFTTAAFHDLWPVIKLSVSSGVMLCLELWYNAVLVLIAGYMSNAEVAISAFSPQYRNLGTYVLPWLHGVRVSNELGRGNAKAAKFAVKVISITSVFFGVIFWLVCFFFGGKIGSLFTTDEEVVETISNLSTLLAFTVFLNSVQSVFTGVAIGAGWQGIVAYVNIGCYYCIGVPLGAVLGYVADLSVTGIWIGMICGVVMQVIVLGFITWRTNWDDQVKKASERLNRWFLKENSEGSTQNESHS